MWKSASSPYKSRLPDPQAIVDKIEVFHRGEKVLLKVRFSTEKFSTFHRLLWKIYATS